MEGLLGGGGFLITLFSGVWDDLVGIAVSAPRVWVFSHNSCSMLGSATLWRLGLLSSLPDNCGACPSFLFACFFL